MKLTFYKYQATGNDFVILDNRNKEISLTTEQVAQLCHRRFGIGADGLMLLNIQAGYDFAMKYYNSDGKEGTMCGNGGRALTRFAFDMGIKKNKMSFIAIDGTHTSELSEDGWVHLKMKDVSNVENYYGDYVLDTGSPHYVKLVSNVMEMDVYNEGYKIRYSEDFAENGINVNFVEQLAEDKITVRTYERGVENETLSCGTGVTASALISHHNANGFNRIEVKTLGGHLAVEYEKISENSFQNIWLCGPATFVYKGEIEI